ncbi:hypothetical protein KSF73_16780 [Burkholderiaceae bacterium DAT-1]|nr:hypothetical protein [Burkholderiaceae bacterium DAT-1]
MIEMAKNFDGWSGTEPSLRVEKTDLDNIGAMGKPIQVLATQNVLLE